MTGPLRQRYCPPASKQLAENRSLFLPPILTPTESPSPNLTLTESPRRIVNQTLRFLESLALALRPSLLQAEQPDQLSALPVFSKHYQGQCMQRPANPVLGDCRHLRPTAYSLSVNRKCPET